MKATKFRSRVKVVTIGQCAIACSNTTEGLIGMMSDIGYSRFVGCPKDIPQMLIALLAPLHPRFIEYYNDNLMTLWKMKNGQGTENARLAVESYLPEWAIKVVVWFPVMRKEFAELLASDASDLRMRLSSEQRSFQNRIERASRKSSEPTNASTAACGT